MAKKDKNRVDVSMEQGGLSDNPFAALKGLNVPEASLIPETPKAQIVALYTVAKTRKGGWPVRVEKRGGGKVVTLISGVSGDGKSLLKSLQKHLGVGGKVEGDIVQLQGDHVVKVIAFLDSP